MMKFKKGYNLKIISILISMLLVFNDVASAASFTKETLRVPLDKRYVRLIENLKENAASHKDTSPIKYDYICVSLTNYCPIQCPMCFMQATPFKNKSVSLSNDAIDKLLGYLKEKKISKITLTGGEPTAEMEKLLRFIREAEVDSIAVFTSGYFAVNDRKAEDMLDAISHALADRKDLGKKPVKFFIRVSVDKFHSRVPITSIVRIIRLFEKYHDSKYKDISLGLKGILTDDDPIPLLVESLGGEVHTKSTDSFFLFKDVILKSGFAFNVEYTELKFIEETLGKDIKTGHFDKIYPNRLKEKDKILIGANQNGIALSISHDGTISIHEYLIKSLPLANIEDDDFDKEVERWLVSDPLIVVLRNMGLGAVVAILNEIDSDIAKRALEANNQFLVISQLMAKPSIKEYVYKRLYRLAKDNGWLQTDSVSLVDLYLSNCQMLRTRL